MGHGSSRGLCDPPPPPPLHISTTTATTTTNLTYTTATMTITPALPLHHQFPYTHHLECGVYLRKR